MEPDDIRFFVIFDIPHKTFIPHKNFIYREFATVIGAIAWAKAHKIKSYAVYTGGQEHGTQDYLYRSKAWVIRWGTAFEKWPFTLRYRPWRKENLEKIRL